MIEKLPAGTTGGRTPPHLLNRLMTPIMLRIHRRSGDKFSGMNLLYLTTTGARSGESRTNPVARFDDGRGGWFVVASAGGATQHPGWYHNLVAHPDQVWVEVSGARHHVNVEQLSGDDRSSAWQLIVSEAPRFAGYETKTDRPIPVLRLTSDAAGS
jgi:deazaflavin-dependent oxidoreductase (nitroreductase family)